MAPIATRNRTLFVLLILSTFSTGVVLALESKEENTRAVDPAIVDGLIQKAMKAWRVPGVAVGIVRDGKIVYLQGHGLRSLEGNDPVTPDTVFPLASCSKAFTTAALAQMVDEKLIRWDDPVRKHLPDFHLADPLADHDVNLRDLLCHRTGLGHLDWIWYRTRWSAEERIKRIGQIPLERPFRTAFIYQSTMYTAAGLWAAHAGEATWPNLIRKRILNPLKMERTVFTSTAAEDLEPARGHVLVGNDRVERIPPFFMTQPEPAGSIHSSARDLCRWLNYQLQAPLLQETHQPQMVIPMTSQDHKKHPETVQMSYGLGWVIQDYRGIQLCSHAGLIDGFRIHLCLVPRHRLGVVILNNLDRTEMNQTLTNTLLDEFLQLPRRDWNRYHRDLIQQRENQEKVEFEEKVARNHQPTSPSQPLTGFVGTYHQAVAGELAVTITGQRLKIQWEQLEMVLEHHQKDTFLGRDARGQVYTFRFEGSPTGKMTGVLIPEILPLPFLRK